MAKEKLHGNRKGRNWMQTAPNRTGSPDQTKSPAKKEKKKSKLSRNKSRAGEREEVIDPNSTQQAILRCREIGVGRNHNLLERGCHGDLRRRSSGGLRVTEGERNGQLGIRCSGSDRRALSTRGGEGAWVLVLDFVGRERRRW